MVGAMVAVGAAMADSVDDYLRAQKETHRIPGLAVTVVRGGQQIKTVALGMANLESQTPVTSDSRFEIGSITKQFTAAGILLLVQDGKLGLDDMIQERLQETPAAWSKVTVRHLLTHTSGIRTYTGLSGFELTKHLNQRQFIEAIGSQPMDFQPGEAWKYCNTGYNLLGYIIESVSGTNYFEFLRQRIFLPLGMTNTTERRPSQIITNRVAGYETTNHILINRDYDLTDVFSAGDLVSTVGDLARWSVALDGGRMLNSTSKQAMWTPTRLNSGKETTYGFGWNIRKVDGRLNIGHNGSTSGFSASIQRFPDEDLAVIVLTNTDEQVAGEIALGVARLVIGKK
jgi:CubicO group peptidase (beta-lactamase class C family)